VEFRWGWQERVFPLRPASAARVFSPVPVPFQTLHHNHPALQHYNSFQMEVVHMRNKIWLLKNRTPCLSIMLLCTGRANTAG
jgi:hypothetical protein